MDSLGVPVSNCTAKPFDKRFKENHSIHYNLISGKKAFEKFRKVIGFRVLNDITKIKIWETFGYCPPKLNLAEKIGILEGKKNPLEYYGNARI